MKPAPGQLSIFNRPSAFEVMCDDLEKEGDPDGLRYYQRDAHNAIFGSWAWHRSTLIVLAGGLGKTQIFSSVAKHVEGRVLVLAHVDELVVQARKRLEQMSGEYVDVEKAEQVSSPRTRLVAGSVMSMNQKRLERLGKHRFDYIITDEAHRSVAPSYRRIYDFFTDALMLGVTATPNRADQKALGKVWEDVAYSFDLSDGIDAGYLAPFNFAESKEIIIKDIDLDHIGKSQGDLNVHELDEEMAKNCEAIVRKTLELQPNRTGIAFFPGVRSAELACQRFNALKPNSAAFVCGTTDEMERRRIMDDFRHQRVQFLCNCQIATEGFDAPATSLIIHGRPTLSTPLYSQMIYRGARVLPNVVEKFEGRGLAKERKDAIAASRKPDFVVLDFVGNTTKHNLATVTDVLGGRYSSAEVKTAKELVKKGGNPGEALEQARAKLKAAAELVHRAKVTVTAEIRSLDPFHVLGLKVKDEERYAERFGMKPASVKQLAALARWGVEQRDLTGLSAVAAGKLMDQCIGRQRHGLCTLNQLRQLQRFGVTEKNVPFDRASAALNYISSKGWGKRGQIDHQVIQDIVHHRRAAGED